MSLPVFETGPRFPQVVCGQDLGGSLAQMVPSVVPTELRNGFRPKLGQRGGLVSDPDMAEVVRVWRDLPEHIRRTILTLAQIVRR